MSDQRQALLGKNEKMALIMVNSCQLKTMTLHNLVEIGVRNIKRTEYLAYHTECVLRVVLHNNSLPAKLLNQSLPKSVGTNLPAWPLLWDTQDQFWYLTNHLIMRHNAGKKLEYNQLPYLEIKSP